MKSLTLANIVRLFFCFIISGSILCAAKRGEDVSKPRIGNKAQGLVDLETFVDQFSPKLTESKETSDNKIIIEIPSFFAITHEEVKQFFDESAAREFDKLWHSFVDHQQSRGTTLTGESKKILRTLRTLIESFFARNNFVIKDETRNILFTDFVTQTQRKHKVMMVRSSSVEDNPTFSLAGGNLTIPSRIDLKSISHNMGRVIASYVSEESLGQRLMVNDPTAFDAPFMPILLQVQAGSSGIPTSGVLLTQEPAGQTPGVAHIAASWGCGDGVVRGSVPCDTFFCSDYGIIHPVIRVKHKRVVVDEAFKTGYQTNAPELRNRPCLEKQVICTLQKMAAELQNFYNKPMNIEFVVETKLYNKSSSWIKRVPALIALSKKQQAYAQKKWEEKVTVISLVQARPVVVRTKKPSYIAETYLEHLERYRSVESRIIKGTMIVNADCAVREIKSRSQIIMEKTPGQALDAYRDHMDQKSVRCVIVEEVAPGISHEGLVFEENNIPVVQVIAFEQFLEKHKFPLLVDTQRGLIVLLDLSAPTYQKYKQNPLHLIVRSGFITHPIPGIVSHVSDFCVPLSIDEKKQLTATEKPASGKKINLAFYVKSLKATNEPDDFKDLQTSLHYIQGLLFHAYKSVEIIKQKVAHGFSINPELIPYLNRAFDHIKSCAKELIGVLRELQANPTSTGLQLKRLYVLKFLEACITQWPLDTIVDNYSLCSLLKVEKQEQHLLSKLESEEEKYTLPTSYRDYLLQLTKVGKLAQKSVQTLWTEFEIALTEFGRDASITNARKLSVIKHAATIVGRMGPLKLLPLWLEHSFIPTWKKTQGKSSKYRVIRTLKNLVTEFEQSEKMLAQIEVLERAMSELVLNDLGQPEKFEHAWSLLQNNLYASFVSDDFIAQGKRILDGDSLEKHVLYETMRRFVDCFDTGIKYLMGSPWYKENKQLKKTRVRKVLQASLAILERWLLLCNEQNFTRLMPEIPDKPARIVELLGGIKKIVMCEYKEAEEKEKDEKESKDEVQDTEIDSIDLSPGFIVALALFDSRVLRKPVTYGDAFTTIHQNTTKLLSTFVKLLPVVGEEKDAKNADLLITIATEVINAAIEVEHTIKQPLMTSNSLPMQFEWALRAHSASLMLDRLSDEAYSLKVTFQNGGFIDWTSIQHIAHFATLFSGFEFIQEPCETNPRYGISLKGFTWKLTSKSQVKHLRLYISMMGDLTLGFKSPEQYMQELCEKLNISKWYCANVMVRAYVDYIKSIDWSAPYPPSKASSLLSIALETLVNTWSPSRYTHTLDAVVGLMEEEQTILYSQYYCVSRFEQMNIFLGNLLKVPYMPKLERDRLVTATKKYLNKMEILFEQPLEKYKARGFHSAETDEAFTQRLREYTQDKKIIAMLKVKTEDFAA